MPRYEEAYEELVRRSRERSMLVSCLELLSWDELTYMPRGGVENRARQTAYLAGLWHQQLTDPRLDALLAIVEQKDTSDPLSGHAVNIREWRRQHTRAVRVPRSLVEEIARVATEAQQVWAAARQDNDFASLLPALEQIVRLKRSEADCLGHDGEPYDALLDEFEPGATAAQLTALFAALRSELQPLLEAIQRGPRTTTRDVLLREYPIDRQRILGESIAQELGFDFDRGRLDATVHPFFSWIGQGDCRITTRYNQYQFGEAFFAILHELGHALYEQGLDAENYGTPLGESSSLGIHESQSRLWENQVGRSRAFWQRFYPRVRDVFHSTLHDVEWDEFYQAANHVEPDWNRVSADEVTYDLHILIRFELEQALIAGELPVADLPQAWKEKYRDYLGVVVRDDREGCLQDGHWSAGQFGYFPSYTLGNVYAAQLMAAARQQIFGFGEALREGDFQPLLEWLREKIYRQGQRYPAPALIEHVTGAAADHRALIDYLWDKYGRIYNVQP